MKPSVCIFWDDALFKFVRSLPRPFINVAMLRPFVLRVVGI